MGKYIDSEKLIAEIKRFSAIEYDDSTWGDDVANGALDYVLEKIIPSFQQEQSEVDLVAELKHHMDITPKEQLEKEWEELEPWGNIGPTVHEFLYGKQPEVDLEKVLSGWMGHYAYENGGEYPSAIDIARHFYELGKNSK